MHIVVSPVVLGSGENLLADINLLKLGYKVSKQVATEAALHVVLTKEPSK
jgi:hypothetical protein